MSRFARNKDGNHAAIVGALRACGASVEVLETTQGGTPDLLVGIFGLDQLVEVKDGAAKDKRQRNLNDAQVAWHGNWKGRKPVVVRSVEEAVELVSVMRGVMTSAEVAR